MEKITLGRVQRKLERLNWDNYQRDFQDKHPRVLDTYWHCVAADLLSNDIINNHNALEKFHLLFFNSFSNCFYFSVELLQKVLGAFDRYSYYYRYDKEEAEWHKLKRKYRDQMRRSLINLAQSVRSNYKSGERITTRRNMVIKNLGAFDHFHKTAGLPVSNFIIYHLKDAIYDENLVSPINELRGCEFNFLADHGLVKSLQKIGLTFLKATMKYYAMRNVSHELDEPTSRFKAYPRLSTKEAVKDFHKRYPNLLNRPLAHKAQLVRTCYRNSEGEKLKLDSIKKALSRMNH